VYNFEENIIEELISGNHKAFEKIFNTYYKKLYVFSKEYVIDSETARELVQEAFVKLWEVKNQLRADTNIPAYLYTMVRNNSINFLKQSIVKKKYAEYSQFKYQQYLLNYYALIDESSEKLIYKELEDKIHDIIEHLPKKCKTVFKLSRFQELKHKEIASQLNISVKTVENHIAEALKRIHIQLADYLL
jgi:RNA polymerase sigma-70 factor (ECF subfamily)